MTWPYGKVERSKERVGLSKVCRYRMTKVGGDDESKRESANPGRRAKRTNKSKQASKSVKQSLRTRGHNRKSDFQLEGVPGQLCTLSMLQGRFYLFNSPSNT